MPVSYYTQVLLSFLFIGGLLFLVYYFSSHYKQRVFSGELKVLDRLTVEKGVSLVVVEYKQSVLLLGISQRSIVTIKERSLSST